MRKSAGPSTDPWGNTIWHVNGSVEYAQNPNSEQPSLRKLLTRTLIFSVISRVFILIQMVLVN